MYAVCIALKQYAHRPEECPQLLYFVRCRLFMDSVDEWTVHPVKMFSDRCIGKQHEFFDKLVGVPSLRYPNMCRQSLFIESYIGFVKIEVKTSSVLTIFSECDCQIIHHVKIFFYMGILFCHSLVVLLKQIRNIVIYESFLRVDDTLIYLMTHYCARRSHFHIYGKSQAVFSRVQAADIIAERFRQHWNHLVYQIYTRSSLEGFLV